MSLKARPHSYQALLPPFGPIGPKLAAGGQPFVLWPVAHGLEASVIIMIFSTTDRFFVGVCFCENMFPKVRSKELPKMACGCVGGLGV